MELELLYLASHIFHNFVLKLKDVLKMYLLFCIYMHHDQMHILGSNNPMSLINFQEQEKCAIWATQP